MERIKRVICWDLWGTLVLSSWKGQNYEDCLLESGVQFTDPPDRVTLQATVRGRLMTDRARREKAFDLVVSGRKYLPYAWCTSMIVGHDPIYSQMVEAWTGENEAAEWLPDATEVLRTLKPWGRQVLVTNTTEPGWLTVKDKLHLTDEQRFGQDVVLSCDLPVAKPDPYVWQTVERRYRGADEYWMIGNDPVIDIAVPQAMGWKTILVNHPDGVSITQVPTIIRNQEV